MVFSMAHMSSDPRCEQNSLGAAILLDHCFWETLQEVRSATEEQRAMDLEPSLEIGVGSIYPAVN